MRGPAAVVPLVHLVLVLLGLGILPRAQIVILQLSKRWERLTCKRIPQSHHCQINLKRSKLFGTLNLTRKTTPQNFVYLVIRVAFGSNVSPPFCWMMFCDYHLWSTALRPETTVGRKTCGCMCLNRRMRVFGGRGEKCIWALIWMADCLQYQHVFQHTSQIVRCVLGKSM